MTLAESIANVASHGQIVVSNVEKSGSYSALASSVDLNVERTCSYALLVGYRTASPDQLALLNLERTERQGG